MANTASALPSSTFATQQIAQDIPEDSFTQSIVNGVVSQISNVILTPLTNIFNQLWNPISESLSWFPPLNIQNEFAVEESLMLFGLFISSAGILISFFTVSILAFAFFIVLTSVFFVGSYFMLKHRNLAIEDQILQAHNHTLQNQNTSLQQSHAQFIVDANRVNEANEANWQVYLTEKAALKEVYHKYKDLLPLHNKSQEELTRMKDQCWNLKCENLSLQKSLDQRTQEKDKCTEQYQTTREQYVALHAKYNSLKAKVQQSNAIISAVLEPDTAL